MSESFDDRKPQVHQVRIIVVPLKELAGHSSSVGHLMLSHDAAKDAAKAFVATRVHTTLTAPDVIAVQDKVFTYYDGGVVPHDDAVKASIIPLWTESDIIHWTSTEPFEIVAVHKAEHLLKPHYNNPEAPPQPFYVAPPYVSHRVVYRSHVFYVAQSSMAMASADRQQYKATIRVADYTLDPDILCGRPPGG